MTRADLHRSRRRAIPARAGSAARGIAARCRDLRFRPPAALHTQCYLARWAAHAEDRRTPRSPRLRARRAGTGIRRRSQTRRAFADSAAGGCQWRDRVERRLCLHAAEWNNAGAVGRPRGFSLIGVSSELPAPLAKSASASLPLHIEISGTGDNSELRANLADRLRAALALDS